MSTVSTFLWFDNQAEEAAIRYTSLIKNSAVLDVARGPDGAAFMVTFQLDGQQFHALNGGPAHTFSEAASIFVSVETQSEVDELWTALTADGGEDGPCGWLKDRYGLSWQIIPTALPQLMSDPNPAKAGAVMAAMRQMSKICVQDLQDAYDAA